MEGKRLLLDTKTPKQGKTESKELKGKEMPPPSQDDPHVAFQKRCIREKLSKKEVVEYFVQFIQAAEAKL